jgi:outer membrane protein assembly factor BamB
MLLLTIVQLPLPAASDFLMLAIGWSARLASPVLDAPAIDSARVYLPLRAGRVTALSLADGREVWTIHVPIATAIASDGERLFTATASELVALDSASGQTLWRLPAAGITSSPAARSGWVLAGAGPDLLALRADTGTLVWRTSLGAALHAPVTIDGDRAYASVADGSVVSLDIRDGRVLWRTALETPCGQPSAAGERLFVGCEDNFLYSLDGNDGGSRWRWRTGADVIAPSANDGERVYFASFDNLLRALDFDSGVQRWRHSMDLRPLSGPVLDEDVLIVSTSEHMRAVRIKDGTLAGTLPVPAELAAPAVFAPRDAAGGTRVVIVTGAATGDWRVYGLLRSPEPAPGPLTETPGRPLSPAVPPAPPGSPPRGASRLP